MSDWLIQMRLTVDETMLGEVQERLRVCVADVDSRPRFITAEAWMVDQMEGLRRLPEPLGRTSVSGPEHSGTVRR